MPLEFTSEAFEGVGITSSFDAAGGDDNAELTYYVVDTPLHDDALAAVISQVTADYPTSIYSRLLPAQIDLNEVGIGTWHAKVKWKSINGKDGEKNRPPLVPNQSKFSFDTTGGRFGITEAQDQTKFGPDSVDFGKRINVTKDSVDGTEIVIPRLTFQITQRFCPDFVTLAYAKTVTELTGTVNDDAYLGFAAGELLFTGASGGQQAEGGQPEVTFNFEASPNLTSISYGSITVTSKKGHEYVWVHYVDTDDGVDTVKEIRGVYVAKVYKSASWAALQLVSPEATTPAACT